MKIWMWMKSLSWLVIGGAVIAAIGMIFNARRAGKMEAEVAHGEAKIKELHQGSVADIREAKKLQSNITKKKIKAREVREKSERSLERIGKDETMADIADRFNNRTGRVRRRSGTAT